VSPPQSLPLKTAWVIAPRYEGSPESLPHAESEADYVCRTFAGTKVDPADVERIDRTLKAEPRTLVHFVCHGAKGRPGIQVIYVQGNEQRLTSKMARAMDGVKAQCRAGAVIFLNACEIGQPVPALVGVGGFARVFTELGAGAVIAPLWSVDDTIAHDVATRFYTEVASNSGRPYAEILRDIRRRAYNPQTGLDTYAAYCFYGDPRAKPS
jgi:CHAT domain-containing protein